MYIEYFGLKEFPFISGPDARFLYLSDQVNEVLQKCLYVIDSRIGPLYVYGPIGTGKTTLANRLLQQLQQSERYRVAYLVIPPQLSSANTLLRAVMDELDAKTQRSYAGSLTNLARWLLEQHKQGIKPVVILDEAQNLGPAHLKLVHYLLNYETSREKLLQLVLFGQNELAQKIDRFPELKSRMYPAALTALSRDDTAAMLAYRWAVAAGKPERLPFPPVVIDELFRASLGMPRDLVKLCDLCLLRTASQQRHEVSVDDVATAARELSLAYAPEVAEE
jgi:general secretion pathway protein A